MAVVVRMPSVMANATEAAVQKWLAAVGQKVAIGDPLAEIETEKAVVDYAAESEGEVGRLLVDEGSQVEIGAPIAVILGAGEGPDDIGPALEAAGIAVTPVEGAPGPELELEEAGEPEPESTPAPVADAAPTSADAASPNGGGRLFASPLARRIAREKGVDLDSLTGTGPGGRITRRDVETAPASVTVAPVAATPAPAASKPPEPAPVSPPVLGATTPVAAAPAGPAEYEDVPLTGMRRAIARRLTESKTTVPHFYVTAHVEVDALIGLRRQLNEDAPRKISINDLIVKAVAGALIAVPAANAIWNGDSIRRFSHADVAVAVAVDGGLLTPVVRGADRSSLGEVSSTIAELAERARAGRLQQHELEGGSFSVSNLGMYGVDDFSAILNPPQSGILAVSAAKPRPVVGEDGQVTVANVMTVTLSADHRVIDGAVAAEWMAAFVKRVEHPLAILI